MPQAAIPYIAAAIAAVGTASAAAAQSQQASYQAAVAKNNQTIAEGQAKYAMQKGQIAEEAKQQQTAQLIAKQRATAGAAGLDVDSGSPLRLQQQSAQLGAVDALTIRNNSAREAYGYRVQGLSYAATAGLDEARASQAETAGLLNTTSSIAGSAQTNKWGW